MEKTWVVLGCILAGFGVAAGAFGAHALRDVLTVDLLAVYETAARYQLVHALALLFVGLASAMWPDRRWNIAASLFAVGVVVFAGSLYMLALTGARWLGAITPIGGACFLAGWLVTAGAATRSMGRPVASRFTDGEA
jgi:uncharacterized membrane protein YgdD (TMEM256/DUF423 family)